MLFLGPGLSTQWLSLCPLHLSDTSHSAALSPFTRTGWPSPLAQGPVSSLQGHQLLEHSSHGLRLLACSLHASLWSTASVFVSCIFSPDEVGGTLSQLFVSTLAPVFWELSLASAVFLSTHIPRTHLWWRACVRSPSGSHRHACVSVCTRNPYGALRDPILGFSAPALLTFEPGNSVFRGAVLCVQKYLAASLASTHQMPMALP